MQSFNYAKTLESYMIPAIEAENNPMPTKEKIKTYVAGLFLAALGIVAIKGSIDDKKRMNERVNQEAIKKAEQAAKEKARREEWEKYKASPEYEKDCKYISNKYKIDYPNNFDKKVLASRLSDAIEKDLQKMANALNRDKKLCNALAEKYLARVKEEDSDFFEKYKKDFEYEADEIRHGPACGRIFEESADMFVFEISDIEQSPRAWVCCHFLFDNFCNAINAKYYREIKLGIMSRMQDLGDGDEGLIGYSFKL